MLRKVYRILPLFIVVWLARKCEVVRVHGKYWHIVFKDVLVKQKNRRESYEKRRFGSTSEEE